MDEKPKSAAERIVAKLRGLPKDRRDRLLNTAETFMELLEFRKRQREKAATMHADRPDKRSTGPDWRCLVETAGTNEQTLKRSSPRKIELLLENAPPKEITQDALLAWKEETGARVVSVKVFNPASNSTDYWPS